MRIVLQRVTQARVTPGGAIGPGLCLLVGVSAADDESTADAAAGKVDTGGEALVVSQFTLLADTRKGNRPSFSDAARPETAEPLVARFAAALRALGVAVATGLLGGQS